MIIHTGDVPSMATIKHKSMSRALSMQRHCCFLKMPFPIIYLLCSITYNKYIYYESPAQCTGTVTYTLYNHRHGAGTGISPPIPTPQQDPSCVFGILSSQCFWYSSKMLIVSKAYSSLPSSISLYKYKSVCPFGFQWILGLLPFCLLQTNMHVFM